MDNATTTWALTVTMASGEVRDCGTYASRDTAEWRAEVIRTLDTVASATVTAVRS